MDTRVPEAEPETTAALVACQRARVMETRAPRRHRPARPTQAPVVFQLLQCQHHNPSAAMLLTGRTEDGRHVTVSVPDPEYTFYLQRAAPFADDADAAAFLAELEDLIVAHREDAFHVPTKGGSPATDREEQHNPARYLVKRDGADRAGLRVRGWARADGVFRTMYGWTPPEARLDNLLAVYVHEPRLVRLYTQFIDSDEYLGAVGALPGGPHPGHVVRAFQGSVVEPELRLRMAQGVTLGGWCALTRFYVKPASFAPLHTDAYYVADGGMAALRGLPERTDTAPLRIASFDIEAAGRDGRFPVPIWSVKRLRDYLNVQHSVPTAQLDYALGAVRAAAIRAGMDRAEARTASFAALYAHLEAAHKETRAEAGKKKTVFSLKAAGLTKRTFGSVDAMRKTLGREYPALKRVLPTDRDTDPAFLIVYVEWTFGRDHALRFSYQRALLYVHPEQEAPYDRPPRHRYVPVDTSDAAADLDVRSLPDQYRRLPVTEYRSEARMIYGFTDLLHERRPDSLTGWNIVNFDLPFLFERILFLLEHGAPQERAFLAEAGPLNFGLVRGGKSYAREVTKSTNAGGDRSFLKVSTDFLANLDGQVVWQNTSFGEREARGNKLDIVSESRLVYPGTKVPRRKVEVDVTKGGEYWRQGGRWLWIFIAYCAVDARLPVQLLLAKGKIPLAVGLARLANVSLQAVYNNGLQMKVVSLLAQELYEHRGNRELLVEYGRRHLHWPDVWLRAEIAAGLHAPTPADAPPARPRSPERARPLRAGAHVFAPMSPLDADLGTPAAKRVRPDRGADPPVVAETDDDDAPGPGGTKRPRENAATPDANPRLRKRLRRIVHAKQRARTANAVDGDALTYVFRTARFQPVPEGMKGYEGAHVFEPTRGLILDAIATADFASLYPFIIISHFLCYMTFLTSTMIAHYGVPRHHYVAVPLGEAERIFCGEARYDPADAAAQEYPTPELKEAFFYADADNVLRNMLLRVYKQRKVFKGIMAEWKLYARVLAAGRGAAAHAKWRDDPDALPGAESYIENGRAFARLAKAVESGVDAYDALYTQARAAAGGDDVVDHVAAAENQRANADSSQLACKFIINGSYGFTTSSAAIAMVPLMEIGAAVTSYGRVCIRSSAYAANNLTVPEVIAAMKRQARTDLDALLEEALAPGKRPHTADDVDVVGLPRKRIRLTLEGDHRDLSREEIRAMHADVYPQALYTHGGDSVVGATPVLVRARPTTRDPWQPARYVRIEALHETLPAAEWHWVREGEKDVMHLPGDAEGTLLQTWSDRGWTAVTRIIRHETRKRLCRVTTPSGTVTVTEDHSLLDPEGRECRPGEVRIGTALLHHTLPTPESGPVPRDPVLKAATDYWELHGARETALSAQFRQVVELEWLGPNPVGAPVYDLETGNHHFAAGVGELVVHNTDSVMVGYPRAYAGSKTRDVVKLAEFVAAWIDQYMRDLMVLEQEKTSEQTLFFGCKNYLMDLFGTKILYKGFEPVRRDTLPFVRLTVVRAVEIVLGKVAGPGRAQPAAAYADRLWDAVAHIKTRLLQLARGEVPIAELTQSQQIRKLVYASPPVAMGAVEKMQARGQRIEIGDRVLFVYCRQPQTAETDRRVLVRKARSYIKPDKARDLADDVTHAIRHNKPVDYEFYYQNKVKNPLRKLLRPLLAPVADFPAVEIGMTKEEQKRVKDRAKKVKKWQNVQVDRVLFGEVDDYFAQRRRLEYNRTLRRTQRQSALSIEYECPVCADFFAVASFARPATADAHAPLCPGCDARTATLRAEAETQREANKAAMTEKLATCHDCIARSGFAGDIQPSDCRKYFCSVFEEREALSIAKLQLRQRLENLGVTDPAQLEW